MGRRNPHPDFQERVLLLCPRNPSSTSGLSFRLDGFGLGSFAPFKTSFYHCALCSHGQGCYPYLLGTRKDHSTDISLRIVSGTTKTSLYRNIPGETFLGSSTGSPSSPFMGIPISPGLLLFYFPCVEISNFPLISVCTPKSKFRP